MGAGYPGEEPVAGRYSAEPPEPEAEPVRRRHAMDYAEGVAAHRLPSEHGTWASPHQEQEPVAPDPVARAGAPPEADWEPVSAEGHWRPAGTPGSNWASSGNGFSTAPEPAQALVPEPSPGRHASPSGEAATAEEEPSAHHRIPAEAPTSNSAHAEGQGQSVAELLARLQATESGGGRRRRREN